MLLKDMRNKKADISMNMIVFAIIALVVLIVVVVIFAGKTGKTAQSLEGINSCANRNGSCVNQQAATTARSGGQQCFPYLGCPESGGDKQNTYCCFT